MALGLLVESGRCQTEKIRRPEKLTEKCTSKTNSNSSGNYNSEKNKISVGAVGKNGTTFTATG